MQTDAFPDGGIVPQKYAGRGGVQPGFTFSNAPQGTVSYAIIFHDLDVALGGNPTDVLHWVVWNIPASAGGIPEGAAGRRRPGAQHHRSERVLRTRGTGRSPLPSLRLRTVRAQCESGPARHGGTRWQYLLPALRAAGRLPCAARGTSVLRLLHVTSLLDPLQQVPNDGVPDPRRPAPGR